MILWIITFCSLNSDYQYGVRGTPLDWFKNYLYNRSQFVKIDNTKSNYETIVCGIPQGSTLGPLLLLLYINDPPNCSKKLSFRIFADDTNVFYTSDKLQHLETVMNEELELVFKYCIINKLSINLAKTNYMLISSSRSNGCINLINLILNVKVK